MIRPAIGFAPLVPLNEASVVIVPLPLASSKTVPSSRGASRRRCAEQIAAAVHDQAAHAGCAVGAVERSQRGDRAAAWASSNTVPSSSRRLPDAVPYRLPLLSMIRPACGYCPVGAVERSQRGDRAAALGQLENRAVARAPP